MKIRGNLFYRGKIIEAGIKIENGKIKDIGKNIDGEKVRGVILPAAIDVHVHFRDFKEKHKETIRSGSLSALFGGVCLVVDQPNSLPRVENREVYFKRMEKAEKESYVVYKLNLGLTVKNSGNIGKEIGEIEEKYRIPAIGEVFLENSDPNLQVEYEVLFELRSSIKKLITVHAEDPSGVEPPENPNFHSRPPKAEIKAVKKVIEYGGFHFCHISTHDAAKIVAGSDSTFEVTPHHLLLSIEDFDRGGFSNVNPPLRHKSEAIKLLKNFDKVDLIASDHAPHTIEEKKDGLPGFPGVETMYPLMLSLVDRGVIKLGTLVEKLAVNPARIFGFDGFGEIEIGNYANFAVFNMSEKIKIKAERLHSSAGWTPYEGFEAVFPSQVFIMGQKAVESGELLI